MVGNRIKQFREYNNIKEEILADFLGISLETYRNYEKGIENPGIDIIEKLAHCYKVTTNEIYGKSPRLALHSDITSIDDDESVPQKILKMSDLSWDEMQLILYYRTADPDDELIRKIIQKNNDDNK